jgi:hypothetical protein
VVLPLYANSFKETVTYMQQMKLKALVTRRTAARTRRPAAHKPGARCGSDGGATETQASDLGAGGSEAVTHRETAGTAVGEHTADRTAEARDWPKTERAAAPIDRGWSPWTRLAGVAVLAVAMAHVEGVLVYYLSRFVPGVPEQYDRGFRFPTQYMTVERSRELATILMLLAIGYLVGRTWWQKAAYYLFAFGCWDVCYYISLRVLLHWPRSPTDRDLLFLIPVQWWGPVWEPLAFSVVFMAAGVIVLKVTRRA